MIEAFTEFIDGSDTEVDDGVDIDFLPGSIEAKKAWLEIETEAHSPESIERARSMGYEDADGWYKDGPLRKGAHAGDSDYEFMVDKLVYHHGYSPGVAAKIAGKVRWSIGG
jgi:hypothetical protein